MTTRPVLTAILGGAPRKQTRAQLRTQLPPTVNASGVDLSESESGLLPNPFANRQGSTPVDRELYAPFLDATGYAHPFGNDPKPASTSSKLRGEPVDKLHKEEVAKWFERRRQDFHALRGVKLSKAADPPFQVIFGGNREPNDVSIRSGSFDIRRNPKASAEAVADAIHAPHRVAIWEYECQGTPNCDCQKNKDKRMVIS